MSTSSISSNNSYMSMAQLFNQPKQDLSSLANALNSGNVSSAQTALSTFQQDLQTFQSATGSSGLPANLNNDLQQIQSALSSNNLTDAKADFDNFLQDLQGKTSQLHHHHHHFHQGGGSQNNSQISNSPATGSGNTTGTMINLTA